MTDRKRLISVFILLVLVSLFAAFFDYDNLWRKIGSGRFWNLGLDLAGGSFLTYEVDLSRVDFKDRDSVVGGLRDVIERRVNLFGVSEPRVYSENSAGKNRLVVELAGIKDVSQAIKEIGSTPFLDFREVVEESSSSLTFIPTELSGRYVKGAQISRDPTTYAIEIDLTLNDEGAVIFQNITKRNVGKSLCMFLDNQLIIPDSPLDSCPRVQGEISGGRAKITGQFTIERAKEIVKRFNAGALPAPITLINQQTINADFGKDALTKAIFAGAIGALAIIVFMLIYYRGLGVYASVALLMYIALTLAVFKVIPITLTLAGIAGFILSMGMAVDANILVFERTKEELKKGLSRGAAIEEGFKRAWTSIRDSNVSTLITSAILYYFTSSFVKGFALTLFIGVVVSMFSAITITRTMLRIFLKNNPSFLARKQSDSSETVIKL